MATTQSIANGIEIGKQVGALWDDMQANEGFTYRECAEATFGAAIHGLKETGMDRAMMHAILDALFNMSEAVEELKEKVCQ